MERLVKRRHPIAELSPMHHSRARGLGIIRPLNMDRMEISIEHAQALDSVVLGVFADMSNAGASLAESLRAIYMTGVQNTLAVISEQEASHGTGNV